MPPILTKIKINKDEHKLYYIATAFSYSCITLNYLYIQVIFVYLVFFFIQKYDTDNTTLCKAELKK